MSYPTLSEICEAARGILGDQSVEGGDLFRDTILTTHVQRAVRDVWRALQNIQAPLIVRTRYAILRANTVSLDPKGTVSSLTSAMPDFAEPIAIRERSDLTEYTVTAASQVATGVQLTTSASHGRAAGDRVTLSGLVNSAGKQMGGDGLYGISVVDADELVALGAYMRVGGTWDSGGTIVYSANWFGPMKKAGRLEVQKSGSAALEFWAWNEDRLTFPGSDVDRQLAITYRSTATTPEDPEDVVGIEDSKDCLATMAAAYACRVRMPTIYAGLIRDAFGTSGERDASGGMLRDLVLPINNSTQLDRDKQRPRIEFLESRFVGLSL